MDGCSRIARLIGYDGGMFGFRRRSLIRVLEDARVLLARPENDYSWSSWHDTAHALAEIDGYILQLREGKSPNKTTLEVLFAPTGPIQEVSLSSGWSKDFLKLADRFDKAI